MPTAYVALRLNDPREASMLPLALEKQFVVALPFEPERSYHVQRGQSHLWAWFKDDKLQPAASWFDGDSKTTAISGYGVDAGGNLFDATCAARAETLESVWQRFHGEWSACCIDQEGTITAAASAPGTEHVYFTEQPGFIAISDRARLLWAALRTNHAPIVLDYETLSGLLSVGYPICTDATTVRGIHLLSSTDRMEVRPQGAARIHTLDPTYFLPKGAAPDWHVMADGLRNNVRWLNRTHVPILAALTGGKDSRLVLAALHAEGLDQRVHYYLSIPPEHADFLVASAISGRFGLTLERHEPFLTRDLIVSIRRHVAFTEGLLNAWDLKAGTRPYVSQIWVHGLFGELYRGRHGATPGDLDAASRMFLPSIDCGIVRPEIRQAERTRLRQWIADLIEHDVPWDRIRDAYYLRQRIPRWVGQTKLCDGLFGLQVNPLYCPSVLQGYGTLAESDRVGERVHFELMRALCEELVSVSFARDHWDPVMLEHSSAPTTTCPEPTDHARPIFGSGWQAPALRECWPSARATIVGALGRLDTIVIPDRVQALLDVLELALDVPMSTVRKSRIWLQNPRLAYACRSNQGPMMQQALGLLTLAVVPDDIDRSARMLIST